MKIIVEKRLISMSYADRLFVKMVKTILENNEITTGEVRPIYNDGKNANSYKSFGIVNRYRLDIEFPVLTLYPIEIANSMREILWIYQKKSNKLDDLRLDIWDSFSLDGTSLGKAYGYQLKKKNQYKEGTFDQVDRILWELKNTPNSRRMVINLFIHADLKDMSVYPCAYTSVFNVSNNKLNLVLLQRSSDVIKSNNWNVCQYALLLMMFASVSGLGYGELIHVISDAHIYDRNLHIARGVIKRKKYPPPKIYLKQHNSFYDYSVDDISIIEYSHGKTISFEKIKR